MSNEKLEKYQTKIRLKLESIKFELTKESFESIKKAMINIYTEEYSKFDELGFITIEKVKEFIEGNKEEPCKDSLSGFHSFWLMTLQPALISEITYRIKYELYPLFDFKAIEKQTYQNIFEIMKSKKD